MTRKEIEEYVYKFAGLVEKTVEDNYILIMSYCFLSVIVSNDGMFNMLHQAMIERLGHLDVTIVGDAGQMLAFFIGIFFGIGLISYATRTAAGLISDKPELMSFACMVFTLTVIDYPGVALGFLIMIAYLSISKIPFLIVMRTNHEQETKE